MKITVKSYLYSLNHSGTFAMQLEGEAVLGDVVDVLADRIPQLARLRDHISKKDVVLMKNGRRTSDLQAPVRDADRIMLLDSSYGG